MDIKTLLIFVCGLSILIALHELGHFIAAKIFNVYVYEYSLFMGPKIFQFKIGETKYTLRCLPIGGYCSMAGEEDIQANRNEQELEEEKTPLEIEQEIVNGKKAKPKKVEEPLPDVPLERTMKGIKNWKKLIIMAAGPIMNVILCFFLLVIFYGCGESSTVNVAPNSLAEEAGFKNNDHIEDFQIVFYDDIYYSEAPKEKFIQGVVSAATEIESFFTMDNIVDAGYGYIYDVLKEYDETLTSIPASLDVDYRFKVNGEVIVIETEFPIVLSTDKESIRTDNKKSLTQLGLSSAGGYKFGESIKRSFKQEGRMSILIYQSLGKLFTKEGIQNVSGVVGMYRQTKVVMSYGFMYFIYFLALISVNLGIMNLLPFPALDGGQIVIVLIEMISKKKCPEKVKGILNVVGFALLIGIMILVTVKDIFFPI